MSINLLYAKIVLISLIMFSTHIHGMEEGNLNTKEETFDQQKSTSNETVENLQQITQENENLCSKLENNLEKQEFNESSKNLIRIKEYSSDDDSDNDDEDTKEEIGGKSTLEKLTKVINVTWYGDSATYGPALLNKTLHKALGISKNCPTNSKQIMEWFILSRELDHEVDRIIREQTLKLLNGHPNNQIAYITQLIIAADQQKIELSDNARTMILCAILYQEQRLNYKKKCTNNKSNDNEETNKKGDEPQYINEIINIYEKSCTKSKAEPIEQYWFTKKLKKLVNEATERFSDKESSLEKAILTGTLEEQLQIERYQSKKFINFIKSISPNAKPTDLNSEKAERFFRHLGDCMTISHKVDRYIQEMLAKTKEEHEKSVNLIKFNKLEESINSCETYGYLLTPIVKQSYNYVMGLIGNEKKLSKNTQETMKILQNKFIPTQNNNIDKIKENNN